MPIEYSVDQSNLRAIIAGFPKQITEILSQPLTTDISGDFSNVAFCGMGGSAMVGDLVAAVIEEPLPIFISRDYTLPREVNKESLIIIVSYSGGTEESIAAFQDAIKRGYHVIAMSTGGKLADLAQTAGQTFVKIPPLEVPAPRFSTGKQLALVLQLLNRAGLIRDYSEDLRHAVTFLENVQLEDQARALANNLQGKIPLIYSSQRFFTLARIFKIKINENSKSAAFWNVFPEMNHNEMNGLVEAKKQGPFAAIYLRDPSDHPRNLKRFDITKKIMEERDINVYEYELPQGSALMKLLWGLQFGDWASYHLALNLGIDPTPVAMVEDFKKRMEK